VKKVRLVLVAEGGLARRSECRVSSCWLVCLYFVCRSVITCSRVRLDERRTAFPPTAAALSGEQRVAVGRFSGQPHSGGVHVPRSRCGDLSLYEQGRYGMPPLRGLAVDQLLELPLTSCWNPHSPKLQTAAEYMSLMVTQILRPDAPTGGPSAATASENSL
jgi:hypothetical protein